MTEGKLADWPDLTRTAAAIDSYDAIRESYLKGCQARAQRTGEDEGCATWKDLRDATNAIKEAFADDTADRNQRETALMVAPRDPWLRGLVARWRERQ